MPLKMPDRVYGLYGLPTYSKRTSFLIYESIDWRIAFSYEDTSRDWFLSVGGFHILICMQFESWRYKNQLLIALPKVS